MNYKCISCGNVVPTNTLTSWLRGRYQVHLELGLWSCADPSLNPEIPVPLTGWVTLDMVLDLLKHNFPHLQKALWENSPKATGRIRQANTWEVPGIQSVVHGVAMLVITPGSYQTTTSLSALVGGQKHPLLPLLSICFWLSASLPPLPTGPVHPFPPFPLPPPSSLPFMLSSFPGSSPLPPNSSYTLSHKRPLYLSWLLSWFSLTQDVTLALLTIAHT